MHKKKILSSLIVLGCAATALVSCKKEPEPEPVYVDPYEVVVNKPMMIEHDDDPTTFCWSPVQGADGYLIKIDNQEQQGIGNPVAVLNENNVCYYVLNTDSLSKGEHSVQFAAYSKDVISEWTDVYKVVIAEVMVAAPHLTSDLSVYLVEGVTKVEFDFGSNIKASVLVDSSRYSQLTVTPETLGIADKLTFGQTYMVTACVVKDGVTSEKSNPVSYVYNNCYYNTLSAPKFFMDTLYFEEALNNPSLTIKLNDKEYNVVYPQYNVESLELSDLLNILVDNKLIKHGDYLKNDTLSLAVKVNFDSNHYTASEYSNTLTKTNLVEDKQVAKNILETVNYSLEGSEYIIAINPNVFEDFVSVEATVDGEKVSLETFSKEIEGNQYLVVTFDVAETAKKIEFTVTYERGDYKLTKSFEDDVEVEEEVVERLEEVKVYQVKVYDQTLSWSVNRSNVNLDSQYYIEITQGSNVKTYTSNSTFLDLTDLDFSGNVSIQVFASYDYKKLESSASDAVSLRRMASPYNIYINDRKIDVPEGCKYVVYTNYNRSVYTGGQTISLSNDIVKIEGINEGDAITTIDSKPAVFELNVVSLDDMNYTIEDAQYVVLKDQKWSNLVADSYKKYIETTTDGIEKFNMALFNNDNNSLVLGSRNFTLFPDSENTIIADSFYVNSKFSFAPNVHLVENTSYYTYRNVSWETNSNIRYDGAYEILIEKENPNYTSDKDRYVKDTDFSKDSTTSTSVNLTNLPDGIYRIRIRTLGNGNILAGEYLQLRYIANNSKIELEDVKLYSNSYYSGTSTRLEIKNDNNLYFDYEIYNSNGYYLNGGSSSKYIDLNESNYSKIKIFLPTSYSTSTIYRYLPSTEFALTRVSTNSSNIYAYKVGTYDIESIPYKLSYSDRTIYASYYDNKAKTWKFVTQAGEVIVDQTLVENVLTDVKEEYVAVSLDFNGYSVNKNNFILGDSNSNYNSSLYNSLIVKKDAVLLDILTKEISLVSTNNQLVWKLVQTDGTSGEVTLVDLTAEVKAADGLSLRLVDEDKVVKEYDYTITSDLVDPDDLKIKVYASGKIERGTEDITDQVEVNGNIVREKSYGAYFFLNDENKTYGPYAPADTPSNYIVSPHLIESCEENIENMKLNDVPAEEIEVFETILELYKSIKLNVYEEYIAILTNDIHTATYALNLDENNSQTIVNLNDNTQMEITLFDNNTYIVTFGF